MKIEIKQQKAKEKQRENEEKESDRARKLKAKELERARKVEPCVLLPNPLNTTQVRGKQSTRGSTSTFTFFQYWRTVVTEDSPQTV